jgi:hypothetical protein
MGPSIFFKSPYNAEQNSLIHVCKNKENMVTFFKNKEKTEDMS